MSKPPPLPAHTTVPAKRRVGQAHFSRLFAEPAHADHEEGSFTAHIDGAARGNPGPASYGVVILKPDGQPLEQLRKYIGRMTNNVAEYYALIAALDYAAAHSIRKLRIRSDSELLVRQMQGSYKVKSADLKPLHERAKKLAAALEYFDIQHVRREQNAHADALANEVLDHPGSSALSPSSDRYFSGRELDAQDFRDEQNYKLGKRTVRAVYRHGAFHPGEAINIPEGTEVEIILKKK